MAFETGISELEKLSFLDLSAPLNGRTLIFGPYFNNEKEWELWMDSPNGLMPLSSYLSLLLTTKPLTFQSCLPIAVSHNSLRIAIVAKNVDNSD